jgi:transcriptional regulator with XRE-family HTH domain
MGSLPRPRPKDLARKLRHIRTSFGLSQTEMVLRLGFSQLVRSNISAYERGLREPPLPVLLAYARIVGVCVEILIDDGLKLPVNLPVRPSHSAETGRKAKKLARRIL